MGEITHDPCNLEKLHECDLEPVEDDLFNEQEWKAIITEVRANVPLEMDLFVRRCGGHYITSPIGYYDPEVELTRTIEYAFGTKYMRSRMQILRGEGIRANVIPILSDSELVFVADGEFKGYLIEDVYFLSGEYLKPKTDPDLWELYPADKFFSALIYDWDYILPDDMRPREKELAVAAQRGDWKSIESALDSGQGVDSALDSDGRTLLWYASYTNKSDTIDRLIARGANPNLLMKIGEDDPCNPMSALVGIAGKGINIRAANALLRGGASVGREVSNQHPWFDKDELPRKAMLDLLKSYGFKE